MPKLLSDILGIIAYWGSWSEMVVVKLTDIMSGSITWIYLLYKSIGLASYSGWL